MPNIHHASALLDIASDEMLDVEANIVNLDDHDFCSPITKHKHTIKNALYRADSSPQYLESSNHKIEYKNISKAKLDHELDPLLGIKTSPKDQIHSEQRFSFRQNQNRLRQQM